MINPFNHSLQERIFHLGLRLWRSYRRCYYPRLIQVGFTLLVLLFVMHCMVIREYISLRVLSLEIPKEENSQTQAAASRIPLSSDSIQANRNQFIETFENTLYKQSARRIQWDTTSGELSLSFQDQISQQQPDVAASVQSVFFVWQDLRNDEGDIYAQRLDKAGNRLWLQDLRINTDISSDINSDARNALQTEPTVVIDATDHLWIAWVDNRKSDRQIFLQRIDNQGQPQWVADLHISPTITGTQQGAPDLGMLQNGHALVTWHDNRSGNYDVYAQVVDRNGNSLWQDALRLNSDTSGQPQTDPVVTVTSSGDAVIAWLDRRSGSGDIYVQRVREDLAHASGMKVWATERLVNTPATTSSQAPAITTHKDSASIAWMSTEGMVHAQKLDAAGAAQWSDNQRINATNQLAAADSSPAIQSATDGTSLVMWKQARDGQLVSQHISERGMRLQNDDHPVSSAAIILATSFQIPRLAYADDFYWTTWPDQRLDSNGDLLAQLLSLEGEPLWREDIQYNESQGAVDQKAATTVAIDDTTLVIWQDERLGRPSIYGQRFSAQGQMLWPVDVPLLSYELPENAQLVLDVATDGSTITVVWADAHTGQSQVYLQQLDLQGRRLLATPIRIQRQKQQEENGNHAQLNPRLDTTATGQIFLTWEEHGADGAIVVAQQRDADLTVLSEDTIARGRFPDIAVNDSNKIQLLWISITGSDVDLFTKQIPDSFVNSGLYRSVRVNHLDGSVDRFAPPKVELDASGSANIVWVDRNESGIYLQRLQGGISPIFPSNLLLNTTPGTFTSAPSLAVDAQGETIVSWQEFYEGEFTIVAQRLDAQGDPRWRSESFRDVIVSVDAVDAQRPTISVGTDGMSAIVWQDARKQNQDIFLQKISASGSLIFPQDVDITARERFFQVSGTVESTVLNDDGREVRAATIIADYERNGGSLDFQLTNDDGLTWTAVQLGIPHIFDSAGAQLRWRAILNADPTRPQRSPLLHKIVIEYSDTEPTTTPSADLYEFNDVCEQAQPIQVNGTSQTHQLNLGPDAGANNINIDQDWVWFEANANQAYRISIRETSQVPLHGILRAGGRHRNLATDHENIRVRLFDGCNTTEPIAISSQGALGSHIDWTSKRSGRYYLQITPFEAIAGSDNVTVQLSVAEQQLPGLAIVAAGPIDDADAKMNYTHNAGQLAYQALRSRGYTDAQIHYLDASPNESNLFPAPDGLLTLESLQDSIDTWAVDSINDKSNLLLYLVGNGSNGQVVLADGDAVSPTALDLWLSNLADHAAIDEMAILIEANQAGQFISSQGHGAENNGTITRTLSRPNRILMTSTHGEGIAWSSPAGFVFSDSFWLAFAEGYTLVESFAIGRESVAAHDYACLPHGEPCQEPGFDDNGNGEANDLLDGAIGQITLRDPAASSTMSPRITLVTVTVDSQAAEFVIDANITNTTAESRVEAHLIPIDVQYEPTDGSIATHDHPTVLLTRLDHQNQHLRAASENGIVFRGAYAGSASLTNTQIVIYVWGGDQPPAYPYVLPATSAGNGPAEIYIPFIALEQQS